MERELRHLTAKLKRGHTDAFDKLYELTKKGVYFMIYSIVKNKHLAEDLMQDTYIGFLTKIFDVDEQGNVYSYLLTMARNKSLNEMKRLGRYADGEILNTLECPATENISPLLDFAKEKLPAEEWHILKLTVVDGYKRVEVAKMLSKPVSTLNRQYNAILAKVEKLYKEVYYD